MYAGVRVKYGCVQVYVGVNVDVWNYIWVYQVYVYGVYGSICRWMGVCAVV